MDLPLASGRRHESWKSVVPVSWSEIGIPDAETRQRTVSPKRTNSCGRRRNRDRSSSGHAGRGRKRPHSWGHRHRRRRIRRSGACPSPTQAIFSSGWKTVVPGNLVQSKPGRSNWGDVVCFFVSVGLALKLTEIRRGTRSTVGRSCRSSTPHQRCSRRFPTNGWPRTFARFARSRTQCSSHGAAERVQTMRTSLTTARSEAAGVTISKSSPTRRPRSALANR